jgi:hypothetical protein
MGVLTDLPKKVEAEQYLRKCTLILYGIDGNGIDLSELKIKFAVKKSVDQVPNSADIYVYNVSKETALKIFGELSPSVNLNTGGSVTKGRVLLQAGYEGNFGVVFQGNIKQIILGRESAVDTFINIQAGDGDTAYNFAVVNTTLMAGSSQTDQLNAASSQMNKFGTGVGHVGEMPDQKLPRGKVLYGNAKNYLRDIAQNTGKTWSIQDEQITFVPVNSYLPGERVILNSKTGLIGTPQQTNVGLNIKCLLNPLIKVGGLVDINEATVADFKINVSSLGSQNEIPAPYAQDGVYFVLAIDYSGDTRGVDWYCTLIAIITDPSNGLINSVQVGNGGL